MIYLNRKYVFDMKKRTNFFLKGLGDYFKVCKFSEDTMLCIERNVYTYEVLFIQSFEDMAKTKYLPRISNL